MYSSNMSAAFNLNTVQPQLVLGSQPKNWWKIKFQLQECLINDDLQHIRHALVPFHFICWYVLNF